jgi:hypothetical protein
VIGMALYLVFNRYSAAADATAAPAAATSMLALTILVQKLAHDLPRICGLFRDGRMPIATKLSSLYWPEIVTQNQHPREE